jgi:hypothetical protein
MCRSLASLVVVVLCMQWAWGAEQEPKGKSECILFNKSYGQRLKQSKDGIRLWWASSGWKIDPDRPVPKGRSGSVDVSLAKNEAEAVQLVINPKRGLKNLTARLGELRGTNGKTLPADCVDVLRVRYVNIERRTDRTGIEGSWPDPLPPFKAPISLEAKKNQPLWLRVHAPKNAAAGEYEGVITLEAEGFRAEVPLRVTVYDFALPDRSTIKTAFGFDPGMVFRYQKVTDPEQKRLVIARYFESFRDHRISPYDPTPFSGCTLSWRKLGPDEGTDLPEADRKLLQERALTPVFDWSAWDAEIEHSFAAYQFNTIRFSIPGVSGGTLNGKPEPELLGCKEDDRPYQLAFKAVCQGTQEHLREKGLLDAAFLYWFDEPTPQEYPTVHDAFVKVKAAAPDINRMITEQPEEGLFGGPNIWCPMTLNFKFENTQARQKLGERIWWYVCTVPKAPFATLFIDHAATDLRVWLWQAWKYNVEGILIWQSNLWTTSCAYPDRLQNPYEDPMSWEHGGSLKAGDKKPWGNGDGRFMYPPEAATGYQEETILEGPVDTMRWEMLRDGIEDYEYLAILRDALGKKGDKLSGQERTQFNALLDVPEDIAADLKRFTRDPAPIEARRAQLAKAIEKLLR